MEIKAVSTALYCQANGGYEGVVTFSIDSTTIWKDNTGIIRNNRHAAQQDAEQKLVKMMNAGELK